MVVQAAAAAELIDRSPEAARKAMHEVQATGAGAMTEMRHKLGLMRGGNAAGRRPQPAREDRRPLGEPDRPGNTAWAAARPGSLDLPDRPGIAHQRAQAREREPLRG